MLKARCRIPRWGKILVTSRRSSPRRIKAVSNNGEMSIFIHQATVTPTANSAVPATTGYRGISLRLGGGRISFTLQLRRRREAGLDSYSYRSASAGKIRAADHDG